MRVSMDRNKLHKHSHLFSMIFLHCKNMKTSRAERVVVKSVLLFFVHCVFLYFLSWELSQSMMKRKWPWAVFRKTYCITEEHRRKLVRLQTKQQWLCMVVPDWINTREYSASSLLASVFKFFLMFYCLIQLYSHERPQCALAFQIEFL